MGSVQKICVGCSVDVANKKRVKDTQGNYYCQSCFEAKRAEKRTPAAAAAAHATESVTAAAAVADPYDFPPAQAEEIGLAEEPKPVVEAMSPDMFGCADCKKLVNSKQIRNDDGDFVCNLCFNKRKAKAAPSSRNQPRKTFAEEEGISDEPGFKDTILGGLVITSGVAMLGFGMMIALNMGFPEKIGHHTFAASVAMTVLTSALQTVLMVFQATSLIVSMFIAARILGGCDFGSLGAAFWKAMAIVVGFTAFNFFIEHSESFGMLGLMFRGALLIITFIAVFRLDYFEAMLLAVINFFVFIGLGMLSLVVIAWAAHLMQPPSDFDDETPHFGQQAPGANLAPVAPDAPAAPQDAAPAAPADGNAAPGN